MAHTVAVVVQARTGSSRLPGKVLADLAGRPMLQLQLERLAPLAEKHLLVVATSMRSDDDEVVKIATASRAEVVRGSESDVLGRFALVIERFRPDTIVRLTGDCPLTDPTIVAAVLDLHMSTGADYASNLLPRSFPKGLDVEVASAAALATADAEANDPAEREHVTPFIYRRPERFRLANLLSGDDLANEWWTVDTPEDLATVRSIVDRLDDPRGATWRDILAVVGSRGLHLRVGAASPQQEVSDAPTQLLLSKADSSS